MNRMDRIFVVHQSPLIDEKGNQYYVSEVTIDDLEKYGYRFLEIVRQGIEAVSRLLSEEAVFRVCRDLRGPDLAICILEKLGDAISIAMRRYFIVPLIPLPLIEKIRKITPTPHDVLYSWILGRGIDAIDKVLSVDLRRLYYNDLENVVNSMLVYLDKVVVPPKDENEAFERLELLMNLPSDTRPGCSLSKLIPHLLITTGLAVVKYVSRYGDVLDKPKYRLSLALLRLAALLHDIGKPYAWVKMYRSGRYFSHASESAKLLDRIGVKDILSRSGFEDLYNALRTLVENHHNIEKLPSDFVINSLNMVIDLKELGLILNEADRDSSNIDRLSKYFVKIAGKVLEEYAKEYGYTVEELFMGVGAAIWNVWLSIPAEVQKKVAELITHSFRARAIPPEVIEEPSDVVKDVKLLVLDIASIQSFIRRESLRILAAASYIIDLCTVYVIPRAIIELLKVPLDSIVYAGGGFVIALVPKFVDNGVVEKIKARVLELLGFAVTINHALVELERSWPRSMRNAVAVLAARKNASFATYFPIETGYEVLCEYCGRRPATMKTQYGEYVCDECKALHQFGNSMYIKTKLETLAAYGYKLAQELLSRIGDIYPYLMPWLSGVPLDALTREQYRIAIVKADGNAAGQYMSSAINITEAMCRSIRIDMGLKLGFIASLSKLKSMLGDERRDEFEDLATRIYAGMLYAGGDDMLAVWPGHIAIPVALSIAKTFWRINGGEIQLSIAIAAAKPKHNIWNVLDAVEYMLKLCKDRYRETLARELGPKLVVVFSLIKGEWQLFEAEVEHLIRRYVNEGISYQPLFIAVERTDSTKSIACSDLWLLLEECFGETLGTSIDSIDRLIDVMYRLYRESFKMEDLVSVIHETMVVKHSHGMEKDLLALYLAYTARRAEDPVDKAVRKGLARLCFICRALPPLFDLYNIAEVYEKR